MSPTELFEVLAAVPAIRELRSTLVSRECDHITHRQATALLGVTCE